MQSFTRMLTALVPTALVFAAQIPPARAEPVDVRLFDVDFATAYELGDRFDPGGDETVNNLQARPGGTRPYRKLTDIRNRLDGKAGRWTAVVSEGTPFAGRFLRVEVPAGEPLSGRLELFHVPDRDRKGLWFAEFDYARLQDGKGGPELFRMEVKNRWGTIVGAPAAWYDAWLGDWRNTDSNRGFELGKVHRVRYEADFGGVRRYRLLFDGVPCESGPAPNASEFGGVSFVFEGKTAAHPRVFGLANLRTGRISGAVWPDDAASGAEPTAKVEPSTAAPARAFDFHPASRRSGPDAGPLPAARAADFIDSLGINVIVYDDARHEEINVPRLAELGIQHLRVGLRKASLKDYRGDGAVMLRNIKDLGQRGYRITGIWNCWHTMAEFETICEYLLPEALHQVEGPNEPWHASENFKWQGQGWPQGPRLFMQDMHATVRGNDVLKHLPIISFSGSTSAYGSIEEWIDYGCEHIYTDNGAAITENDKLQRKIERCRNTNYPTAPLQFTETGYNSGGEDPGIRPTSLWTQARGVPRLFLEGFRHGLARTFVYALHARHDKGFSLVEQDGSPKPAFHAVRSMITILRDEGADATTFTPGGLAVAIEADAPTVHHLLLRKSDGRFYLCLWNDVDGWNEETGEDRSTPDREATLTFGQAPKRMSLFRPAMGGVDAVEHREQVSVMEQIKVPDHPVIVEIVL